MRYPFVLILTSIAVFTCYLIMLLTLQDHVIFYQEQHHLFLYTQAYYEHTLQSQGPLGYVGNFMTQFYYYPWLGAIIVSLLATCVYYFIESIIYKITGFRDFLQLGVIAAVALYFTLDGLEESPVWILLAAIALFIIWIPCYFFIKPRNINRYNSKLSWAQLIIVIVLTAGYFIGGFYIEIGQYNKLERYMIKAEKAVKTKNWDEAIDITSKYLASGRQNKLMFYLRSYALAHKGELIDHLFDYPQTVGQESLAFPWSSNSRETEYGHLVHEATGDINAAHEWAFEAMTVWGETGPHLVDLARYNVALGRPEVAEKFARKLDKTLFYRKDAKKIRKALNGEEPLDIYYAQPDSLSVKWINILDFRPNLMQNFKADPNNKITRQYLIASMLLSNSLKNLIPLLNEEDLKHENIKEAVLIYSLYPNFEPLRNFGFKVNEKTGEQFADFYRLLRRGSPKELEKKYGKTYWYYKHKIYLTENN